MESEIETERKENREDHARHLAESLEYVRAMGEEKNQHTKELNEERAELHSQEHKLKSEEASLAQHREKEKPSSQEQKKRLNQD